MDLSFSHINKGEVNDDKDWLEQLFCQAEDIFLADKTVACRIIEVRESGFIVKAMGLYCFLPFKLMPWRQPTNYWLQMADLLNNKIFYGKIHSIVKRSYGKRRIYVDATAHAFQPFELFYNIEYTGIVFYKSAKSVCVEIGHHYGWKYGSITGYIPMRYFLYPSDFDSLEIGTEVPIFFRNNDGEKNIFEKADHYRQITEKIGANVIAYFEKGYNYSMRLVIEGGICGDFEDERMLIRSYLQYGDEPFECKVVRYDYRKGLIVRIREEKYGNKELMKLRGKIMPVYCYDFGKRKIYLVDDKYPGMFKQGELRLYSNHTHKDFHQLTAKVHAIGNNHICMLKYYDADQDSIKNALHDGK
ncbi:MAG: hypothetical protein LBR48_00615 [Dysgonamonadaceae bacterium]|jgi:hypothetical protein|nr:hypothetical protein [Dysgonamonadaceae bacterium]